MVVTLPIVRPFHPKLGDFATEFNRALQNGRVTNNGEWVQEFERELTRILRVPTICFNNGMSALVAMLMAADVKGGEVLCPSFTFAATPHAIVMAGATPVFCDIDASSLTINWDDAANRITPRTVAVMPVDPYGICAEPPKQWTQGDYDILIDAAPSFGSELGGSSGAGRGKAVIYSFHATKPFSTMEGGALCSFDEGFLDRAAAIRNFGQDVYADCPYVGINGKMPEVNALVGLRNLDTWQHRASARIESAARLRLALDKILGIKVIRAPLGQSPIWTYQPIRILPNFGATRDETYDALMLKGIMVRKYYRPCHQLACYAKDHTRNLPVTELIGSQILSVPLYDEMQDSEIGTIVDALRGIRG